MILYWKHRAILNLEAIYLKNWENLVELIVPFMKLVLLLFSFTNLIVSSFPFCFPLKSSNHTQKVQQFLAVPSEIMSIYVLRWRDEKCSLISQLCWLLYITFKGPIPLNRMDSQCKPLWSYPSWKPLKSMGLNWSEFLWNCTVKSADLTSVFISWWEVVKSCDKYIICDVCVIFTFVNSAYYFFHFYKGYWRYHFNQDPKDLAAWTVEVIITY